MADEKFNKELLTRLDIIIKLIGTGMLNNYNTNKDKILFLNSLGYKPSEIISLTEIPKKTVYNVLSKSRKKTKNNNGV